MASIQSAIRSAIKDCLNVQSKETILILTDEPQMELGQLFHNQAKKFSKNYFYRKQESNYSNYEKLNASKHFKTFISFIKNQKLNGRFLDVGCAFGLLLKEVLPFFNELYGFDISQFSIKKAKQKASETNLIILDLEKSLPFPDELFDCMSEVMYSNKAIGLAAPQLGILKRIIIADVGEGLVQIINPEIIESLRKDKQKEGCLSIPDIEIEIERNERIFVGGIDKSGNEIQKEFKGLLARVIQHEIDHLNGVLLMDYATTIEKFVYREKIHYLEEIYVNRSIHETNNI